MKKIVLSFVLILALLLSFAACELESESETGVNDEGSSETVSGSESESESQAFTSSSVESYIESVVATESIEETVSLGGETTDICEQTSADTTEESETGYVESVTETVIETETAIETESGEEDDENEIDPEDVFDTFYDADYFFFDVYIANTKQSMTSVNGVKFTRFARNGEESSDGFHIFSQTEKPTARGRYLIIKYRTDHMDTGEIWANTKNASHENGKAYSLQHFIADGNWHIKIVDLEEALPSYVEKGGKHALKFFRIDFLNTKASKGYFDISYVALTNKLDKADSYIPDEDRLICGHYYIDEDKTDNVAICAVCGYESDTSLGSAGLNFISYGNGTCYLAGMGSCTDTEVKIPERSPDGDTVVSIRQNAFRNCSSIKSISIPSTVNHIGALAFEGCTGIESIVIPDSVTEIGDSLFLDCTGLKSISVPFIGIDFGSEYSGRLVDYFGFEEDIPSSLCQVTVTYSKQIHDYAFEGFKYLTRITLCEGVETIGEGAFKGCSNLYYVYIPDSIQSISGTAFEGCESIVYNEYEGGLYLGNQENPYVVLIDGCDTDVIHHSTKYIGYEAFATTYVKSFVIPEGVKYIGERAFFGGIYLQSVTVADSVVSIGDGAFSGCSVLEEVVLGEGSGLKYIGYEAFNYCSSLKEFTIPVNVSDIGAYAFSNCESMTDIYFKDIYGWWTTPYAVGSQYFNASYVTYIDASDSASSETMADYLVHNRDYHWHSDDYWYKAK